MSKYDPGLSLLIDMKKLSSINIGDRVAYSVRFLRSISCFSGALPFARGTVAEINPFGSEWRLARVQWDKKDAPEWVNSANLCKVGDHNYAA